MSGMTLNDRFTQHMAASSRPLQSHEQFVHVNLGGAGGGGAANGRGQRHVNGGAGGGQQQLQTSSGRTVGLKKQAPRGEVQRQSVKQQSAQVAGASRATRRDGVQQRAQSGRDKVVQQRRQAAAQAPPMMHALPLQLQPAFLAAPVVPKSFQIAPQFLAAPTTLAFNPGQKQTRQQTQQQGGKGGAKTAQKKGQQQKGAQKGQQQQGSKKGTIKKGAAASNRQAKPAGAAGAGGKGGRQGKPKAGSAAAPKGEASKDSLDADMDSYMAAAPVAAAV